MCLDIISLDIVIFGHFRQKNYIKTPEYETSR